LRAIYADNIPQKNAMDSVLADINIDDPTKNIDSDEDMADVAPRAIQKQEKQRKDKKEKTNKKEKKDKKEGSKDEKKKRRHSEMNGDGELGGDRKKSKKSKSKE